MTAITNNGYAILHILYQTEELKLAAVKQNGHAIQHINDPNLLLLNP